MEDASSGRLKNLASSAEILQLQCDEFLIRAHFFLQKYDRYTGKNTSAESQIFNFSKMARIAFLTMPSLRPFSNGLSGPFKLELLSSDSFYCQGALKISFRREITKRCALRTIAEAIIRAKSQKYGQFSQNARIYGRARIYKGGFVTLQFR